MILCNSALVSHYMCRLRCRIAKMRQMLEATLGEIKAALDDMVVQSDQLVPSIIQGLDANGDGKISKVRTSTYSA